MYAAKSANLSGGTDAKPAHSSGRELPERSPVTGYTPHQSTYLAYRITLEGRGEDAFAKSLSAARVETKPHQVDFRAFRAAFAPIAGRDPR